MVGCQNYIARNDRKSFTLFAHSKNMQVWLCSNIIRENLEDIIIFCSSSADRKYLKDWTRRYTEKIRNIIVYNDLDRDLLIFGLKHIKVLQSKCRGSQIELQSLTEDFNEICLALMDNLKTEMDNQDNYLRLAREAT